MQLAAWGLEQPKEVEQMPEIADPLENLACYLERRALVLLRALKLGGPATARDLAYQTGDRPSGVGITLTTLRADDWVEWDEDTKTYVLTEIGAAALRAHFQLMDALNPNQRPAKQSPPTPRPPRPPTAQPRTFVEGSGSQSVTDKAERPAQQAAARRP